MARVNVEECCLSEGIYSQENGGRPCPFDCLLGSCFVALEGLQRKYAVYEQHRSNNCHRIITEAVRMQNTEALARLEIQITGQENDTKRGILSTAVPG